MLAMTGAATQNVNGRPKRRAPRNNQEEEKKSDEEDDDDVFYECATTAQGLGQRTNVDDFQLIDLGENNAARGPFAETAIVDPDR